MKNKLIILGLFLGIITTSCSSVKVEKSKISDNMQQEDINKMPEAEKAPVIKFQKPQVFKLDNGLTVIVVENHKLPRVNASLRMDNQPIKLRNKKGSDELMSALLGSGSENVNKDEFNKKIDFYGANVRLYDGGFYINSLSKYFPEILALTADQALHPKFTKEEFIKEQEKLIENLKSSEKSTPQAARRVTKKLAYGAHPYGEITTIDNVKNIKLEDVKQYYQKTFNPNHAYLIVVGDVNTDAIKKMAEKHFGTWKKAPQVRGAALPYIKNVPQTEVDFVHMPNADQTEIKVVQRSDIQRNNPDYQKVLLMNEILGGDFNSYLNMTLREKHGWTYGARSRFGVDKYGDLFKASTSVRNSVADSAVVVTMNQINKIINEKVDPKLLYNNKQKYVGNFVLQMEKPATIANQAYNIYVNNLPEDYYETFLQKVDAVTVDDIQQAAKKYLHPDQMRIVVVGNAKTTVPGLEKAGYKINYFDKYGHPTKAPEMNQSIPKGVTPQTIIDKYIKAIGGAEKIARTKSMETEYEGKMQGMVLVNRTKAMAPNKMMNEMLGMGMTLGKEVFDGKTGYKEARGQKIPYTEKEIKSHMNTSQPFPEISLSKTGKLDRMEKIDGQTYYVIIDTDGTEHFFNAQTGLKDQEVQHQKVQGREMTQKIVYKDYKVIEGIKLPGKVILITGVQPLEFILKKASFNKLSEADFK